MPQDRGKDQQGLLCGLARLAAQNFLFKIQGDGVQLIQIFCCTHLLQILQQHSPLPGIKLPPIKKCLDNRFGILHLFHQRVVSLNR